MKLNKKAFSLMEILIVIGIILILATGIMVSVNPGIQFAQGRDANRQTDINNLFNSLMEYKLVNDGYWEDVTLPQEMTEICNTNLENADCSDLIDISVIVDQDYISKIPVDPQGGDDPDGTGYYISGGKLALVADNAETKFIGINIDEKTYNFSCGNQITDPDGQAYDTVKIGSQCWMAENLNYDNGCKSVTWEQSKDVGWCACYEENEANCDTFGLLYQWSAAMDGSTEEGARGICPAGWHIPTDYDWYVLEDYLKTDGNACDPERDDWSCDPAGSKLAGSGHLWASGTLTSHSDFAETGFNGMAGGRRTGGDFYDRYGAAYWWTSTADGVANAGYRPIHYTRSDILRYFNGKYIAHSVRCIRD